MLDKVLVERHANVGFVSYAGELSEKINELHPYVRYVLQSRFNQSEADSLLNTEKQCFYDPFLFNDMKRCTAIIRKAIDENKVICINGDYDCDGILGSTIIYRTLRKFTGRVMVYIPNRETDGYGINKKAVNALIELGGGLLISVDCGVSDHDMVEYAKENGIDVIVTDHHSCPEIMPKADAVLNPKRANEKYPDKNLCGAGIAFKLACAFAGSDAVKDYLDFAAVATVADMAPLIGENRLIVFWGLKKLRGNPDLSLKVLLDDCVKNNEINCERISFSVAPRVNAAGRMGQVDVAKQLFLGERIKKFEDVSESVKMLCNLNEMRKKLQQKILSEAIQMISENKCIIIAGRNWHPGLLGLVATSLTQMYNKPAFVFSDDGDYLKGSVRSIDGINIYDVILQFRDLTERFGGHALAAGLTIRKDRFEAFSFSVNDYFDKTFGDSYFIKKIYYDINADLSEINTKLIEDLNILEPCGIGNPSVSFLFENCYISNCVAFGGNNHVRFDICQNGSRIKGVCFNRNKCELPQSCNVVAKVSKNQYTNIIELYVEEFVEELL